MQESLIECAANICGIAFDAVDFGATLKELNLVPSAALIVK